MREAAAHGDSPRLARGFLGLAGVTYALLVFGASVRVHGAGLSCPDWPLCFGQVIPQLDFHVFLEWGHRVLASVVSLVFLGLAGAVLASPTRRARAGTLVFAAAATLAAQVVLGGLTVLKLLASWSVTLHLLTGNLFFVLLLLTGLRLRGAAPTVTATPALRGVSVALAAMTLGQLALGGLVSSNYAGLSCTEWPTCNGGVWFPVWDGIIGLQLFHRFGAYTLTALALAFWWLARRDATVARPASLVIGAVAVQVGLGVANVLLAMPVEIAILHSATADAIVGLVTLSLWRTWARGATASAAARPPAPAMGLLPEVRP